MGDVSKMLRHVDLFAGTGAFSHVLTKLGVECVFANDCDKSSKKMYDANHASSCPLTLSDIHDLQVESIPAHDILTAGFPCQPFSVAGKQLGFEDKRSNVFWKILEVIDYHKPRCVLLENVKGLVTHDDGKTFQVILSSLRERGYTVSYKVLDTAVVTDIPQHRERIYIVCLRGETGEFDFTSCSTPCIEKKSMTSMLERDVSKKYYYTTSTKIGKEIITAVTKPNVVYQYRRTYVRENKSGECPTLTANMGTGGHNVPLVLDSFESLAPIESDRRSSRNSRGARKLTPRECFTLHGFPADWSFAGLSDSQLYKLAGNAVSVPVVHAICQTLLRQLASS